MKIVQVLSQKFRNKQSQPDPMKSQKQSSAQQNLRDESKLK